IAAIQGGAMLMALAWQNRADRASRDRRQLGRLYLYAAGLLLLLAATVATEHTQRWDMHQSHFYKVSAGVFLFFIISAARGSVPLTISSSDCRSRWRSATRPRGAGCGGATGWRGCSDETPLA